MIDKFELKFAVPCRYNFFKFRQKYKKTTSMDKIISVLHSGLAGDLIYSLSAVRELSRQHGPVTFYINVGKRGFYYEGAVHPDGDVMITEEKAAMLIPLLEAQSYIKEAKIWQGEKVAINLDQTCDFAINKPHGHIPRWYFHIWPELTADLSQPVLFVESEASKDYIVANRTQRYLNPSISYKPLQQIDIPIYFVGTQTEYELFQKEVPKATHYQCEDFLKLAQVIKGAKFFLGNQSMCFAIAEQLKIPRMLEACRGEYNNVIPTGKNAYDFFLQSNFERILEILLK